MKILFRGSTFFAESILNPKMLSWIELHMPDHYHMHMPDHYYMHMPDQTHNTNTDISYISPNAKALGKHFNLTLPII